MVTSDKCFMMHGSAAIITLLALFAVNGVTAIFTHTPVSVTAYLGAQATFSCITDGRDILLVWTVNGVEARFPEIRNKGITFVYSGVNSEMSNLTVLASLQNNNSEIICIQQNVMTGQEIARTSPVYLYIQGLLDPPSNVTVDFKNETIIHLTWLPPFSLKDILDYVVTISVGSSNEVHDEVQTTLPEFIFSWSSSLGYCQNRIIFQVAAVNNLGASNKTSGVEAGFLKSFIEASPFSQTARPGQWVNFTCAIHCSQRDLVVWFLNGSTLSLFQDTGLKFLQYPQHSYCGTSQTMNIETHTLSLMTNYGLSFPLDVQCVMISGCGEGESIEDCVSYTCSGDSVRFELQGMSTEEIHSHHGTSTSADTSKIQSYNILFGTSLGLGAMSLILLTLFITTLVILICYCHRNKRKSIMEREFKIQEVIYDTPAVVTQPNSCAAAINELEMENYRLDESMAPTALQYCPAYETARCIKQS